MSTDTCSASVSYSTLYRIGYWCSLDAECRTKPNSEFPLIDHNVHFVLVNKYGDRCPMGCAIITGQPDRTEVFDEDGETYPHLAAAIREHARQLVEATAMPGLWTTKPMRHETWQGTEATAFDATCHG